MGAAGHDRVPVILRQLRQFLADGRHVAQIQRVGVAHLQDHAGVDDVLRRRAEMHELAMIPGAVRLHLAKQWHEGVLDAPDVGAELGDIDPLDLALGRDLRRCLGRDQPEFRLRLGQRSLDIEPLLQPHLLLENRPGLVRAPVVLHRLHIEDGDAHDVVPCSLLNRGTCGRPNDAFNFIEQNALRSAIRPGVGQNRITVKAGAVRQG